VGRGGEKATGIRSGMEGPRGKKNAEPDRRVSGAEKGRENEGEKKKTLREKIGDTQRIPGNLAGSAVFLGTL